MTFKLLKKLLKSKLTLITILNFVAPGIITSAHRANYFGKNVVSGNRMLKADVTLTTNLKIEALKTFDSLWKDSIKSNNVNLHPQFDIDLLDKFKKINENIANYESFINSFDFHMFSSEWSYMVMDAEINNVNTYYETFVRFQSDNTKGTRKPMIAWSDLAETYLQKSDLGIIRSLQKIHDYATTQNDSENVFKIFEASHSNVCNLKQSPHQIIYNLYNTIALTELKGNTILQFSYLLLRLYGKGNYTLEANLARNKYEENFKQKVMVTRNVLTKADRSIYRCDPLQYVEGVTYIKLTKLLQGYIENEVNINPYGTCMENCGYYGIAEYNGCYKEQFCSRQPQCHGKILDCHYIDSDMKICLSSTSERRYDWVEYENGKILGNKGVCEKKNFFKVDSWWRYLFWHCSYCLCMCDDSHNSDRYFSLRKVTSDTSNNKVVTGVRLVKLNRIIHIQIQQGTLGPRGVIIDGTTSWKPVDNITIDDAAAQYNVDYHTMTWLERAIDIDEVFGPPQHVVTGVRFRKIGGHLNLEVRITPINFTTGEVFKLDYSYWQGNDNTDASLQNPRTQILLKNPDIPIRNGPHSLNSKHDQYIQFQVSSFDTDAGQNTVPFLDSQALTSQGFPLSGIGLIHRGKIGSGGFIAPKLISYDFTPHLNQEP